MAPVVGRCAFLALARPLAFASATLTLHRNTSSNHFDSTLCPLCSHYSLLPSAHVAQLKTRSTFVRSFPLLILISNTAVHAVAGSPRSLASRHSTPNFWLLTSAASPPTARPDTLSSARHGSRRSQAANSIRCVISLLSHDNWLRVLVLASVRFVTNACTSPVPVFPRTYHPSLRRQHFLQKTSGC